MKRLDKRKAALTSLLFLLPVLFGLAAWGRLPFESAASRALIVFGLPAALCALHWGCLLITCADPKQAGQSKKALGVLYWLLPLTGLYLQSLLYAVALKRQFDVMGLVPGFMGVLFLVIGNYLPKMKQNYTLGIKLPWTLANEENWNRTHRLGGKVWVACGLVLLAAALLPVGWMTIVMVAALLAAVLAPGVYSWLLARRQKKAGEWSEPTAPAFGRRAGLAGLAIALAVLLGCGVLMFTGDIRYEAGQDSLTVTATYWQGMTIPYGEIESVEYAEGIPGGRRTWGFGSPRLAMGSFYNDQWGDYTRYSYSDCPACVVLRVNGETVALTGRDAGATRQLYETLLEKTAG